MSRLASHLRLFPSGSFVSPDMMDDHLDMQRSIDRATRAETLEARRVQKEHDCTWAKAMRIVNRRRIAAEDNRIMELADYYLAD